jgi:hypothetical protein
MRTLVGQGSRNQGSGATSCEVPDKTDGPSCGGVEAREPPQRVINFFRFKSDCAEFSFQVRGLRAAVPGVVVFVNEDKYFKHGANIAQKMRRF